MCGILFAKVKREGQNFSDTFQQALALMSYRGPDATGFYQHGNNYFGHVRLSILDLSERSNQPVVSDAHVILFKGEIYNYKQLSPESFSDTLAISSLIHQGDDISTKINGMYAVLVYDKATDSLRVLRDFYGEKPIYYYDDGNIFIISSTIKPIIYILKQAYNKKLNICHQSVHEYLLCGYVREPKTIYENIFMLSSGHELTCNATQFEINNIGSNIINHHSFNNDQHIKCSMQTTDVEPSLLLSSGVDSTYLLSQLKESQTKFNVLTYKSDILEQDESSHAMINLSKICKESVDVNIIENHDDIFNLYTKYPGILEQPSSDGMQLFNLLSLSKQYNKDGRLVILGTGGDELYGGYHSFKNYKIINLLRKMKYLKSKLPKKYQRFYMFDANKVKRTESYYFTYRLCHHLMPYIPEDAINNIFSDFTAEMNKYHFNDDQNPYQKIKIFESFDYMRNQLLRDSDNISLYCGYEARNPFLSVSAYDQTPDGKKSLKTYLKKKYGIKFLSKRGFTLQEEKNKLHDYFVNQIIDHNNSHQVFSQESLRGIIKNSNIPVLRKIYILLAWFSNNHIERNQLLGFTL